MAAHSKPRAQHLSDGSWRADRHADRADVAGVAPADADSVLWSLISRWQSHFDAAEAHVSEFGAAMESAGGQVVANPNVKLMKDADAAIREHCKLLGIGPLNRARLGKGSVEDDSGVLEDDLPASALRR